MFCGWTFFYIFLGIKPFECSICKNKFASNVSLQEHLSRHTDEKPHQCHICQKFFRQVSCLRRHLFTHSTELPFSCHICGRKFSQNVYLRSHMKVHTGLYIYVRDDVVTNIFLFLEYSGNRKKQPTINFSTIMK